MTTTVCPVYANSDGKLVHELGHFLETSCDVLCRSEDGTLHGEESIVDRAESFGLSADALLIVLSADSCRAGWPDRKRWETVLIEQAREGGVDVAFLQVNDCSFPGLFAKRFLFFDARQSKRAALRQVKRWLWQRELRSGSAVERRSSPELEPLYREVSDRIGSMNAPASVTRRFVEEGSQEFAAVIQVPCRSRSVAQVVGFIGVELGMALPGPVSENLDRVRSLLHARRCLLILDAPSTEIRDALAGLRKTSVLVTEDLLQGRSPAVDSFPEARKLVVEGRLAEALEMFERLSILDDIKSMCQREIAWILNAWGEAEKANAIYPDENRFIFARQMPLFG